MKNASLIAGALTAGIALALAPPAVAQSHYKLVKTIDLPGAKGGHGDWTTFDRATDTVWLSQSPDHDVVVIDARAMTVKHVIPDIAEGTGIALSPHYAFLSDHTGNVTVVVDKRSFKKVATLKPVGKGPDGTIYDSHTGTVFVTTDTNDATIFSAKPPFKQLGHFRLSPDPAKDGPDVGNYTRARDRIYQPVDNVIDVINPNTHAILVVWRPGIKGGAKATEYDPKTHHVILGTTDKIELILDARTGKVVASIPIKGSIDETAVDEYARRAYVGDKAGTIDVIDLDTNKVIDELPSEKNVHTLTVDTRHHRVFVYRNVSNKVDVFEPVKKKM